MSTVAARGDEKYEFRIREDTLGSALDAIVRQTNLVVLYPYELADKTGINPVFGRYTVREALAILLRGTKFSGGLTESGTMFVALSGDSKATDREDQVAGGKIKNGLLASAAAFLMPTAGHAAQDVAEADAAREEIIVTARRKEENLQEVPVAVTALNQDALDRLVVNTLDDLNKLAPGLQLGGCIGRTNCGPNIRAQGSSVAAGTTSVVSYFAEVPNFQTSFFDLESIQVLKGPQGTLFGETATGGAILYTPRKPTNEFSAHLGAQLGNYDFKQFDAAIGGPIIDDKLMVRVAGRWRKRDGVTTAFFSDGSAPQHIDDVDEAQWRASIVWKPTDSIENYTIYAGSHYSRRGTSHILAYVDPRFMPVSRRNQIPASNAQLAAAYELYTGSPPPAGMSWTQIAQAALLRQNAAGPRTVFANYDLSTSGNFNGVVNQTRWDILDNLTFRNIFGLFWSKTPGSNTTGSNYDGLDAPIFESRGVVLPGSTSPNTNWGRLGGWPSRDWSEEAQLLGTLFDGRIDWQGGFYYRVTASRDYETATGNVVFAAFSGDPAPVSFCDEAGVASPCSRARRNEGKNYAVYGQATFAVTEEFNLTGGFRHTWDTTTAFE
ncbi:MAG: TonB-dependent receptor plug domain-containing protein, partial [Amphiplicatus sp.]